MNLYWLQGKIAALKVRTSSSQAEFPQLTHRHFEELYETLINSLRKVSSPARGSHKKTHTHPWGSSRAAEFLCFPFLHKSYLLKQHTKQNKTKKHFLWILWWVPKGWSLRTLSLLNCKFMWYRFISDCLAKVNAGVICKPFLVWGNSKFLLQQDWKGHKFFSETFTSPCPGSQWGRDCALSIITQANNPSKQQIILSLSLLNNLSWL